jgi:queuosine precursor transporter
VSQLVDTVVVLFVAFYIFGNWSLKQVIAVSIINYLYKFTVAVILTPLLYLAHGIIDRYLGLDKARQLMAEAAHEKPAVAHGK